MGQHETTGDLWFPASRNLLRIVVSIIPPDDRWITGYFLNPWAGRDTGWTPLEASYVN